MSLETIMQSDRRLVILQSLHAAAGFALRESVIQKVLGTQTSPVSADLLRTDLVWLSEQGLLELDQAPSNWLVSITTRGADVASGSAHVPGVDRPRPGGY